MSQQNTVPTSKLKRSAIAGITAAKVGFSQLSYKAKSKLSSNDDEQALAAHESQMGDMIFAALSQLRGTALKISQLLSMETDLLPEAIREKLKAACHQVPPINKALVRKQVTQSLGQAPNKIFKHFDGEAFAAASIGQVHKAQTHQGETLAVKVQYPGIGATIESDLKIVEQLFWTLSKTTSLLPRKDIVDQIMLEVKSRLNEEVNYEIEADNLLWFNERLKLDNIVTPKVYPEYSDKRVISFSFLEGQHLDEWLATKPSQQQRDKMAQLVFDFFWYSVFQLNKINADPHAGNYLFLKNEQLGVLDFGCVRELSPEFTATISRLLPALIKSLNQQGDKSELLNVYKDLQFIEPDTGVSTFEETIFPSIEELAQWLVDPYINETFDFSQQTPCPAKPNQEQKETAKQIHGLYSEQLCFDRAHLGVLNLLRDIGGTVKTDWLKFRNAQELCKYKSGFDLLDGA